MRCLGYVKWFGILLFLDLILYNGEFTFFNQIKQYSSIFSFLCNVLYMIVCTFSLSHCNLLSVLRITASNLEIQNSKFWIQNSEFKIQNSKFKFQIKSRWYLQSFLKSCAIFYFLCCVFVYHWLYLSVSHCITCLSLVLRFLITLLVSSNLSFVSYPKRISKEPV
jgi:hypothetical protein